MNDINNPWLGLDTYQEGQIIYGRNEEIQILTQYILRNKHTIIYGKSGIGKSSIINAGVFPVARSYNTFPLSIRLNHQDDALAYTLQIKNAITQALQNLRHIEYAIDGAKQIVFSKGAIVEIEKLSDNESETLWTLFHRHKFMDENGKEIYPVIILDQFEEIFTLQRSTNKTKSFFSELANLINDIRPQLNNKPSYNNNISVNSTTSTIEDTDFDDIELIINVNENKYIDNPEYHLAFIIREDFLSYLERYSINIPSLKNNRYCLQPLNVQQATEIILKPVPDLISKDVASLIISKLTQQKAIMGIDNDDIKINSSILSLFMNRLYEKMKDSNGNTITAELVNKYSPDIISEFYEEAIALINSESIIKLEDTLLNPDGRRESLSRASIKAKCGLSDKDLDFLIFNKKILCENTIDGSSKVEFIHDVLCDIIKKRKENRFEANRLKELQLNSEKEHRAVVRKAIFSVSAISLILIALCSWFIYSHSSEPIIEQHQNFNLSLSEDNTVGLTDYWKAQITVIGKKGNDKDTVLFNRIIDKGLKDSIFTICADSINHLYFNLNFDVMQGLGRYVNLNFEKTIEELTNSPSVNLTIGKERLFPYSGKVALDLGYTKYPVQDASILYQNSFTTTDSLGYFTLYMEKQPTADDKLIIAKESFICDEYPLIVENNDLNEYIIESRDSLSGFEKLYNYKDSVEKWNYSTISPKNKGIPTIFTNGRNDELMLKAQIIERNSDKYIVSGYYYFKNEKELLAKNGHEKFAYHFFDGEFDKNVLTDDEGTKYKPFELVGYDIAHNKQTLKGHLTWLRGQWIGEILSSHGKVAEFKSK